MLEIEIDGKQVQVNDGSTGIEAAAVAGSYIPRSFKGSRKRK